MFGVKIIPISIIKICIQLIISRRSMAFKGLRGKRPKKRGKIEGMFHVKHRRRGLRILRFRAGAKAHSLRRASSSSGIRSAGFPRDITGTEPCLIPLPRLLSPQPLGPGRLLLALQANSPCRWVASDRERHSSLPRECKKTPDVSCETSGVFNITSAAGRRKGAVPEESYPRWKRELCRSADRWPRQLPRAGSAWPAPQRR